MFEKISKSRLIFLAALLIGGIGAGGQSYLIYHPLINSYPYKMMSFPSAEFYAGIALFGVFIAPALAVAGGFFLGLKRFWLATIAPVVLCPLLFGTIFKTASLMREWRGLADAGRNFDDTKPAMVAEVFYTGMISYAAAGIIIGAVCCFLLSWLAKDRKLVLKF